jgi:hypothetical protein
MTYIIIFCENDQEDFQTKNILDYEGYYLYDGIYVNNKNRDTNFGFLVYNQHRQTFIVPVKEGYTFIYSYEKFSKLSNNI